MEKGVSASRGHSPRGLLTAVLAAMTGHDLLLLLRRPPSPGQAATTVSRDQPRLDFDRDIFPRFIRILNLPDGLRLKFFLYAPPGVSLVPRFVPSPAMITSFP